MATSGVLLIVCEQLSAECDAVCRSNKTIWVSSHFLLYGDNSLQKTGIIRYAQWHNWDNTFRSAARILVANLRFGFGLRDYPKLKHTILNHWQLTLFRFIGVWSEFNENCISCTNLFYFLQEFHDVDLIEWCEIHSNGPWDLRRDGGARTRGFRSIPWHFPNPTILNVVQCIQWFGKFQ